jgi:hypothetical protein
MLLVNMGLPPNFLEIQGIDPIFFEALPEDLREEIIH